MDRRSAVQGLMTIAAAAPLSGIATGAGRRAPRPGSGYVPVTGDKAKPPKQKMVLVGAGSAMFTQGIVIDWIKQRPEGEWEIALVDINPVILEATEKMVRRYMEATDRPAKITAAVDRRDVLDGATIVICTIGVGSRRAWEQDVFVPRQFGINQPVGDSVAPGGVSRAMRMIPPMVAIASDCDRMCPNARFINYGNPMTAVVRALWRKTNVRAVGLCPRDRGHDAVARRLRGSARAGDHRQVGGPQPPHVDPRVPVPGARTCGPSSGQSWPSAGRPASTRPAGPMPSARRRTRGC